MHSDLRGSAATDADLKNQAQQERPVWQRPVVTTVPLSETLATAGSNSDGGGTTP